MQPSQQEGETTNFQRASVTLGAGVEIYAKRVDSVHSETYKVLGGLSRGQGATGEEPDGDEDGASSLHMDAIERACKRVSHDPVDLWAAHRFAEFLVKQLPPQLPESRLASPNLEEAY